jgi:hypothetical protein
LCPSIRYAPLHFLRRAALAPGERVPVNGASGGVGMAAVQLARHFGAQVTGVCSAANSEVVRSLGAHRVIDYAREDFTRDGAVYDVIMDTAGTAPWSRSRTALRPGGRLLMVLGSFAGTLQAPWIGMTGSRRIVAGTAGAGADDLRFPAPRGVGRVPAGNRPLIRICGYCGGAPVCGHRPEARERRDRDVGGRTMSRVGGELWIDRGCERRPPGRRPRVLPRDRVCIG